MSSKKLYTVSANNLNILLEFSEWPVRTVCQCQYWSQVKVNAPVQRQYLETPPPLPPHLLISPGSHKYALPNI